MKIRRMTATFGKLDRRTLVLSDGLNLIHAPNEAGKSTWGAFLRTMLYGLATRERGLLADKNRYAPWSGASMEGVMEIESGGQEITLTRHTARRGSPMGASSAVYTGTATPVPELSGGQWGETLLGVPREIYERSAFIGQASVPVDQVSSLERRIAALISTGEEDTSYSEARERLKKQLNRRRYNRSGQLPALEAGLAQVEDQLRRAQALNQEAEELQTALSLLEEQEAQRARALEDCERAASLAGRRSYFALLRQLEDAEEQLNQRETEAAGLPGKTGLITLKSAAGSVVVNQMARKRAQDQLALREQETAAAQEKLSPFPIFQGKDGAAALRQAEEDQSIWKRMTSVGRLWRGGGLVGLILCLLGAASFFLPGRPVPLPLFGALLIGAAACGLLIWSGCRKRRQAERLSSQYHAGAEADFAAYAAQYDTLYREWAACRQAEQEARSRLDGLSAAIDSSIQQILSGVQVFSPEVTNLSNATAAIDRAMGRLDRLEKARQQYEQLRIRCETLEATLPAAAPLTEEELTQELPSEDAESLRSALEEIRTALAEQRRRLALTQGQLRSIGDPAELEAQREALERQREELALEYDAIALALEELDLANTDLQNRFSPALGAETARIFTRLTGDRYQKVLLDRDLSAQAEAAGDPIPRAAQLLSQGTMDQLYLAVRLAICHLVLPLDRPAPLVLDDALTSFDDRRMAQALEILLEEAEQRQVLLFTCQERELLWAEGRTGVTILRLTGS